MNKKQNIRIVDIAKMAKVSVGTVDRVLHNRGRVSEEKRQAVEKVLDEINYEPNMVARFLASRKSFSFAVLMPSFESGEYWEQVYSGIDKAAHELKDFNVSIDYLYFDQFDSESFSKMSNELFQNEYAGVIIATMHKEKVINLASKLDEEAIPYVFIDSNINGCKNLSYFGADSVVSGAIAAKLMLREIGDNSNIIIINGQHKEECSSTQTENRERGFLDYLKENKFQGKLSRLTLNLNDKQNSAQRLAETANGKGRVGAIIFNSRIHEVASIVDNIPKSNSSIRLIGYDTIERNAEALLNDKVLYLISQRSIVQGYDSIKALSNHLIFANSPLKENYMPIDILMKENISFYCD